MGEIARRFKMPKATVQNILRRWRESGTAYPKPFISGRKPAFNQEELIKLEKDVLLNPDLTLETLRDRSGKRVSLPCVHRTLIKLGITYKKKAAGQANRRGRRSHRNALTGARGSRQST